MWPLLLLLASTVQALKCLPNDLLLDDDGTLRLQQGQTRINLSPNPWPSFLADDVILYLPDGMALQIGNQTVMRSSLGEMILEYRDPTRAIATRLATFWGQTGYWGDAIIDRLNFKDDGKFHLLGHATTGCADAACHWEKTAEYFLDTPTGQFKGKIQDVSMIGRPGIRCLRVAVDETKPELNFVKCPNNVFVGDVTLDMVVKNTKAAVLVGGVVVSDAVEPGNASGTQCIQPLITGETNRLLARSYSGGSTCKNYVLRHETVETLDTGNASACFVANQSTAITMALSLAGDADSFQVTQGCNTGALKVKVYKASTSCSVTPEDIATLALGTCLLSNTVWFSCTAAT